MGNSVQTKWKWLEVRPKKTTKQLCIKGRNMTVWNLVADIIVSGCAPEEMARRYRLPLEAVQEALAYYHENRAMIDAEVEETKRQLREAGLLKD